MANREHVAILRNGSSAWKKWRTRNYSVIPDLSGEDFSGIDFVGFDLSNANLNKAVLTKVDMTWANLSNAQLFEADLRQGVLKGARLIGTNFSKADLRGVDLREVDFSNTYGITANLSQAKLKGALFTEIGEGGADTGFLELATTQGLESADFGDKTFLSQYIVDAFDYAHSPGSNEIKKWPQFVNRAIRNIKVLREIINTKNETPELLVQVISQLSVELVTYLRDHPRELHNLRPRQFEELIAEVLASFGWKVQLTAPTRDGGYDIYAISSDRLSGLESTWIIECKKYSRQNAVGIDVVRGLYGVKNDLNVANILLATTSYFSQEVRKYKTSHYDLSLRDYNSILEWLGSYSPSQDGQLYMNSHELILPNR